MDEYADGFSCFSKRQTLLALGMNAKCLFRIHIESIH